MPLSLFHLHGDLKDLRFPRLLAALREDDFTGVFQATVRPEGAESEITREVHFQEGSIAWAISTDPEESLRSYLLRNGAITEAQWIQAEEKARETTLRQAIVDLGLAGSAELTQIERGRAEEIVLALFTADRGDYRVRERQLAPGTPHLKIDPRALILRGVLEGGDRALILEEIGSLDTVYVVKRPVLEEPGLNLPGEFQSVLRLVDGKRSIAQVCSLLTVPDYFVCSVFAALSMVGAVRGSHARSATPRRPVIVKGADVSTAARAPRKPAAAQAPDSAQAAIPAAAAAAPEPIAAPPQISTTPFEGEGPITLLDSEPELELEEETLHAEEPPLEIVEDDEDLEEIVAVVEPEVAAPSPPPSRPAVPPGAPPMSAASQRAALDAQRLAERQTWHPDPSPHHDMPDERSRPWFLLGGAMAVGAAALFLILMAQGSGDAVEMPPLPDPTLHAPAPASAGAGAAATPADEDTDEADNESPSLSPAPSIARPSVPAAMPPPEPSRPRESAPAAKVDTAPSSPMLEEIDDERAGRERLLSGDYRGAARHFGRQVADGPGGYSIQILMACQDDTVRRAVEAGSSSPQLFILSTTYQGRSCYRVYWGRYPTQKRAQEALSREIPAAFQRDRPRVTRLAGS